MKRKTRFFMMGIITLLGISCFAYFFLRTTKVDKSFKEGMKEADSKEWEQSQDFSKEEDEGITFELSLIDRCDNGEWIEIADKQANFEPKEYTGVVVGSDQGTENSYAFEEGKTLIFSKPEFGEFFEDRKLLVSAYEKAETLVVLAVKCLEDDSEDEDKSEPVTEQLKKFEQQVMLQLAKETNTLIKKQGTWEVTSFLWPTEEYVYMEVSAIEGDQSSENGKIFKDEEVESYLLLLKITEENQKISAEEVGLLKMDKDDEWVAERGKDLFQDVDDGRLFDFNADLGKWVKIN